MKALLTNGDGAVFVKDIQPPVIGDYDCLVKIKSCLFCNSTDRHIVEKSFNFGIPYPAVLGHESIGYVQETGKKVKNFKKGDLVIRPYAIYPDEVADGTGSGWGGIAEFGKIRDFKAMLVDGILKEDKVPAFFKYMQKLPSETDIRDCEMISCIKEIYSSVKLIDVKAQESFLVLGAGVAGCLFATFLKIAGAKHVAVTARRKEQLVFAAANTPADEFSTIDELYGYALKFDSLVDTSGSASTVGRLLDNVISEEGIFYSYAVYQEMANPSFFDTFKARIKFRRIDPVEASVHEEICEMLAKGNLNFRNYITHRFSINEYQKAWETVIQKKTVKTAIVFE